LNYFGCQKEQKLAIESKTKKKEIFETAFKNKIFENQH